MFRDSGDIFCRMIDYKCRFFLTKLNKIKLFFSGIVNVKKKNVNSVSGTGVLVFIKLDAIGDYIMAYSSFVELIRLYSDKKFVMICSLACAEIAKKWNLFDEIIPIDTKIYLESLTYRKKMNHKLSDLICERCIQMVSHRTYEMECITNRINALEKITINRDNANIIRNCWDKIYSGIVTGIPNDAFEIDKNFRLLDFLGCDASSYICQLPIMADVELPSRYYAVISAGGSFSAKKWKKYGEVADYVIKEYGLDIVLIGDAEDRRGNQDIADTVNIKERVIDMTGQYSICECIEVIRHAELVIGNDTCFIHMAAATDTESVAVAGGWHWKRFLPYSENLKLIGCKKPRVACHMMDCFGCDFGNRKCLELQRGKKGTFPCIENVQIRDVVKLVDEALGAEGEKYFGHEGQ